MKLGWSVRCAATLLLLYSGCASATRIRIQSAEATNEGRSFYVLIRPVGDEEVTADSYEVAAKRVFAREAAPEGQQRHLIIPGQTTSMELSTDRRQDVVLYFFFTEPGDRWWLSIDKRRLDGEIVVELGINEVERIRVRGR